MIVPFIDVHDSVRKVCETHEKLGVNLSMRSGRKTISFTRQEKHPLKTTPNAEPSVWSLHSVRLYTTALRTRVCMCFVCPSRNTALMVTHSKFSAAESSMAFRGWYSSGEDGESSNRNRLRYPSTTLHHKPCNKTVLQRRRRELPCEPPAQPAPRTCRSPVRAPLAAPRSKSLARGAFRPERQARFPRPTVGRWKRPLFLSKTQRPHAAISWRGVVLVFGRYGTTGVIQDKPRGYSSLRVVPSIDRLFPHSGSATPCYLKTQFFLANRQVLPSRRYLLGFTMDDNKSATPRDASPRTRKYPH